MNMPIQTHLDSLCVFVTDNIVNSEHKISTAKGLCYMAPPALVSKCQPRKMCEDCFHYQSTVHNIQGSYWYFAQPLSWVGAWTLDYGVFISIF